MSRIIHANDLANLARPIETKIKETVAACESAFNSLIQREAPKFKDGENVIKFVVSPSSLVMSDVNSFMKRVSMSLLINLRDKGYDVTHAIDARTGHNVLYIKFTINIEDNKLAQRKQRVWEDTELPVEQVKELEKLVI